MQPKPEVARASPSTWLRPPLHGGIDQDDNASGSGHHLTQKRQPLRCDLMDEAIDPSDVAAGPVEARNETDADRVVGGSEDDRDCRGRSFGGASSGGEAMWR